MKSLKLFDHALISLSDKTAMKFTTIIELGKPRIKSLIFSIYSILPENSEKIVI